MVNAHGSDPSRGGAENYIARLTAGLSRRDFEISFLSAFDDGEKPPGWSLVLHRTHWQTSRRRRVITHAEPFVSLPSRRIAAALGAVTPDVVHTHNLVGIGTGIWESCRRASVPVVHSLHDYHLLCPRVTLMRADGEPCRPSPVLCGLRTRSMTRWAPGVSDIIGVSDHVIDVHAALFPGARSHVVRHPIDPSLLSLDPPPGPSLRTIGYLGALETIKGVDRILEAAEALDGRVAFRFAGEGRLRPMVEEAASRIPGVSYEGRVSGAEKRRFIESCDAGILASTWNEPGGPPFAVLEWLCAGRPALISARGGLGEALRLYGGCVAFEPTGDEIAATIAGLAGSPERWRALVDRVSVSGAALDEDEWVGLHEDVLRHASTGPAGE